jgi:hypothetical protein
MKRQTLNPFAAQSKPSTPAEWQVCVDLCNDMLRFAMAQKYRLVEPGVKVNVDLCVELLAEAYISHGISPRNPGPVQGSAQELGLTPGR